MSFSLFCYKIDNMNAKLTPYEDVNSIVLLLLQKSQEILGDNLLAMYLHGSLATGDFSQKGSDIDFMIVLDKELIDETIQKLREMHSDILKNDSKWAKKLEGSYVQKDLLKSVAPPKAPRLYINGSGFNMCPYGYEWVIEKYVIREQSIIVIGTPPSTFIEPVSSEGIRQANTKILCEDWEPMLGESSRLEDDEYQAYAVLTMCSCLFSFTHNKMASKKVAAKWVQEQFSEWRNLVEIALNWTSAQEFNRLNEVKDFIKFTVEFTKNKGGEKDNIA